MPAVTDAQPEARARITDAAAHLLREGGRDAVTTRAVAREANVPAPTIFRIFGSKDGLMDAVAEHVLATYVASKSDLAAHEDGDPVADLRTAWRSHIDFGLANPDLFVLLSLPGRLPRSPAAAAGIDVLEARVRRVAEAGLLGVSQSRAVEMIHAAGTGALLALLQRPAEERDHSLPDSMLEAVLGAVLATTPAPSASDAAPLAIAFVAAVPELPTLSDAERALLTEWVTRSIAALEG